MFRSRILEEPLQLLKTKIPLPLFILIVVFTGIGASAFMWQIAGRDSILFILALWTLFARQLVIDIERVTGRKLL